jgi:hypothetical protein
MLAIAYSVKKEIEVAKWGTPKKILKQQLYKGCLLLSNPVINSYIIFLLFCPADLKKEKQLF